MDFNSELIGLFLIIIGFVLQLISSWKGDKAIKKRFLIFYLLGVAWLVIDNFRNNYLSSGLFNLVIFIIGGILLAKVGITDKDKPIKIKKKRR